MKNVYHITLRFKCILSFSSNAKVSSLIHKANRLNFTHKDKASTHAFIIYQLHRQFTHAIQEESECKKSGKNQLKNLFRWRHSTAQSLWCVEWERRKKKQNNLVSIRKNQFMSLKKTHSFPIYGKISSILCVQQKMCDACVSVILLLCIMLCFFLTRLLLIPFYWTNLMILKD